MTPEFITGFFFDAIKTAISLAAPMLLSGLAVGLLVSIFQAATSINEMTLTFIPKMLAVAVALIFFFPRFCWMPRPYRAKGRAKGDATLFLGQKGTLPFF